MTALQTLALVLSCGVALALLFGGLMLAAKYVGRVLDNIVEGMNE